MTQSQTHAEAAVQSSRIIHIFSYQLYKFANGQKECLDLQKVGERKHQERRELKSSSWKNVETTKRLLK